MSAGTATAEVLACTVRPAWWNFFIEVEKAFSTFALEPLTVRNRRCAAVDVTRRWFFVSQLRTLVAELAVASYFAWYCFALMKCRYDAPAGSET